MKNAILFLNSFCPKDEYPLYRKLAKNKFIIAVDGGFDFVNRLFLTPDIVIGDFDSISKKMLRAVDPGKLLLFPKDKNATDTELALLYCYEERFKKIDIVQPSVGEIDHFLANLFLLSQSIPLSKEISYKPKVRIINKQSEIIYLNSSKIDIAGNKNDIISVIPLSPSVKFSTTGTEYNVNNKVLKRGETLSLRNRIKGRRATITVTGEAFIYHRNKRF